MRLAAEIKKVFREAGFFVPALIFLMTLNGVPQARAEAANLEYEVKAAFLFNFTKFVEWPPRAFSSGSSPIVIGVLGENPFGDVLETTVKDQELYGRPITVKFFNSGEDLKSCHLLFISGSERRAAPDILKQLRQSSVLTVSDMDDFIENGGMIRFIKKENKIRFQINEAAVKGEGNLKISSRLLSLAVR